MHYNSFNEYYIQGYTLTRYPKKNMIWKKHRDILVIQKVYILVILRQKWNRIKTRSKLIPWDKWNWFILSSISTHGFTYMFQIPKSKFLQNLNQWKLVFFVKTIACLKKIEKNLRVQDYRENMWRAGQMSFKCWIVKRKVFFLTNPCSKELCITIA